MARTKSFIMHALLALGLLVSVINAFHLKSMTGIRLLGSHKSATLSRDFNSNPAMRKQSYLQSSVMDDIETGVTLNLKKRAVVDSLVKKLGGKRTIQRILIANNGMAATKAILSMRQWAYMVLGDERALEFVVMATRDDLNANAEFIRLADAFVEVPSGSNKNNYANVDLIVKIAEQEKVDGVWPGWGHASENPKLPANLKAKGIQFIGPTSSVMAALGDKVSANILAQTAKVPSIPWSGEGIECALNAEGVIPQEIFNKACVFSVTDAAATADKIGYPVMIKASEGGGGKGIRMASNPEELKTNFVQVQNEVPGSPIFMMQLCTNARHLEVQIVGDEYGNAVALNGRDCSTQRRFQKIFEEGPPSVAPKDVFRQMELAAQRLTQSIGYIGAGTVEYLYNAASNKFFFLELNPRLQVEHPVTEGLTGVNLPSVQLQVAMGIALDRIPEIRAFYGRNPEGADRIDFMKEEYQYPNNHVIAARITAENPDEGFKPTSGRIERVKFQSTPKVWGYFSVGANGGIHEYADSQFGHLFATGATREQARKSLVLALKEIDVRGDIRTTVEYLIKLLETNEFKDNTIDTSWLDGLIKSKAVSVAMDPQLVALSAAIYKTHSTMNNFMSEFVASLSKGQTSLQSISSMMSFPVEIIFDNVKYIFSVSTLGPNYYQLSINNQVIEIKIREQPDKSLLCTVNDENVQLYGQEEALGLRMKINGNTVMIPNVYNPSELRSDVTGKIVRYLQQDRSFVNKNEPYVEVEAMKMIMALKSTESGVITQNLSPGSIISAGELIASLQLQDTTKIKPISTFTERIQFVPQRSRSTAAQLEELILLALDGYNIDYESAIKSYFESESSVEKVENLISRSLQSFLNYEKVFNNEEGVVISSLIKSNKDNLSKIVPSLVARKQITNRLKILLSILRQFELLPERSNYKFHSIKTSNPALYSTLDELSGLTDATYGPVTLKVKQLVDTINMPSFEVRLDALRKELLALQDLKEVVTLSKQPNIAVSIDLLVVLMSDNDQVVRERATQVYIRRIYRAQDILDIQIESHDPKSVECHWSFQYKDTGKDKAMIRYGYFAMVPSLFHPMTSIVEKASQYLRKSTAAHKQPLNVLHIGIANYNALQPDDDVSNQIAKQIAPYKTSLVDMDVRMVNFFLVNDNNRSKKVSYFNFYHELGYNEEKICRDMRPMMPYLLEVNRLTKNYDLTRMPSVGRNSFVFLGKEKSSNPKDTQQVLFLRSISLSEDSVSANGADRIFNMALEELERATLDQRVTDTASSRLYVNILPEIALPLQKVMKDFKLIMDYLVSKYATRLLKLRVDEIEVKIRAKDEEGSIPVRLIASSTTGGWLTREAYREYVDAESGLTESYCQIAEDGKETNLCVLDPYPTSSTLSKKRAMARRVGSTYVNDFLGLLEVAVIQNWSKYLESAEKHTEVPNNVFSFDELVLKDESKIDLTSPRINNNQNIMQEVQKAKRFPGNNRIGMLAWQVNIKTPHYPEGRDVIVIANDVTIQSGSFGIAEDYFFNKISQYARYLGLPRIFISCNSGARIGLVEELKPKFKVQWKDEGNVQGGFEYLYLTEADFLALPAGTVEAEKVVAKNGDVHYKLSSIIGQINGIGVENLRGSGLIAGETARAYDEVFTLSYVTGRSVGIGAYLNRLGQRVIQMQQGPMILTGYSALNKLLGKEVYTSQDQLGGPQIMYPNGVSHQIVNNDQEGMQKVLQWINYTPKNAKAIAPVLPYGDSIYRTIDFMPSKTPYDVRNMLNGYNTEDGQYISGFCDKNTWEEYLGGWGKSVVVGRGRLGGINIGVIAVETRQVEQRIPADPGNAESRESIQPQAGQVWYPDSAFKTAQAINDFNRGENLPLIIFANWRGFSGGTRDMYGEILKYGAMIVDALKGYKHPVFIYIPPFSELRGGAWVVIDPTINIHKIQMFADKNARGGILEPPGICEVKYRAPEQVNDMHRLDPVLRELDEQLAVALDSEEKTRVLADIKAREKVLAPLYLQIAHEFADLHDRAGRMLAKGCISDVLDWKYTRQFFYWRILKRQREERFKEEVVAISNGKLTLEDAQEKLQSLIPADLNTDEKIVQWFEKNEDAMNKAVQTCKM